jgi:hypothetical protein
MNSECYIYTFTGEKFFPLIPETSKIKIEDIAHALANTCRFTGHVKEFYSVAQHSVYVSLDCPKKLALAGLLHDASEAYLCDVSSPVKRLDSMKPYRDAEAGLQKIIYEHFAVPFMEPPPKVKDADMRVYRTEVDNLMSYPVEGERATSISDFRPWLPREAEFEFLRRYAILTSKKGAQKP